MQLVIAQHPLPATKPVANSRLVYPGAKGLGSASRDLAGIKPSASTKPKRC